MSGALMETRRVLAESSLVDYLEIREDDGVWIPPEILGGESVRKKCKNWLANMESPDDSGNYDDISTGSGSEFDLTNGEDSWPEFFTRVWDDGLDFVLDAYIEILDAIAHVPVFHFTLRILYRFHMME